MERVRHRGDVGVARRQALDPAREACVHLDAEVVSLGVGRRFVAQKLREWNLDEQRIEPIVLVANELVANAVVHAHSAPVLSIEESGSDLLLRVADTSPDPPVRRDATSAVEGGRGLILIEGLCDRWGVDPQPPGKIVWAEFTDAFD